LLLEAEGKDSLSESAEGNAFEKVQFVRCM